MDENIDTGKILMQAAFKIDPDMTGGDLRDRASNIAGLMVPELLYDIENNKIIPLAQDENEASYDKYPFQGINFIDFNESAKRVYDRIRALKPWANCFATLAEPFTRLKMQKSLKLLLKRAAAVQLRKKPQIRFSKSFAPKALLKLRFINKKLLCNFNTFLNAAAIFL